MTGIGEMTNTIHLMLQELIGEMTGIGMMTKSNHLMVHHVKQRDSPQYDVGSLAFQGYNNPYLVRL